MCGIAGIVNLRGDIEAPPPLDALRRMVGSLRHRGPDEFGFFRDSNAALGHARLAIIDLAGGQQPLANETDSTWVIFNGEIFNYLELRDELERCGHRFKTRSDTEVIVHAYEQWGAQAFRRFNGQWAVALWDSLEQCLVLARDPFGVRPIYLCQQGSRLYFASEVKALFAADPSIPRALDAVGLQQIFTFWAPIAPQTTFCGVSELPPGCVRTYVGGRVSETWSSEPAYAESMSIASMTVDEAADAVRSALEDATKLRMLRADVPVGSYLSGGLDSSLIAALALRAKGTQFATFSIRFEDAEYDETAYQHEMAAFLGSRHHEVVVSRADIAAVFPAVVDHAERPILRTAPAPLYLLSRLVRDVGIKVVLTGEGADEMFAGYDLFREGKIRRFWARQPQSALRPRLLERLYPYLERSPVSRRALSQQFFGQRLAEAHLPGFAHDLRWSGASALTRLLTPAWREAASRRDVRAEFVDSLPAAFANWSPLAQDQYLEIRTLLSGYLLSAQGDRMLMAHSVEGRFPFLDRNVAALAESLPPSYKLRVMNEKHVLKRASIGLIPDSIRRRKKQPYRAPDALSFAEPTARDWIEEVVGKSAVREAGIFTPEAAEQIIRKCRSKAASGQFSNTDNVAVVGIVSTQLLYHQLIRPRPAPSAVRFTTAIDRLASVPSALPRA